jgi:TolB-like protein
MPSIIPGFEYDIFISYRQKDNQYDGWVSEFVENLKKELAATFKEEISIYFDINPQDGIQETYNVEKTLENKLKCLIFIPIISQTYSDPRSFAWQYEFCAFNKMAKEGQIPRDVKLSNGNVISRILPVKIRDLDDADKKLLEDEIGGKLRAIEFIFKSPGVNRPLRSNEDRPGDNLNKTFYRDQMNKVANTIKALITGIQPGNKVPEETRVNSQKKSSPVLKKILPGIVALVLLALVLFTYLHFSKVEKKPDKEFEKTIAVLPFDDMSPQHDKEYFTDGMLTEILSNLYKIGDLKVISRTSSMQYKGETKKSIREIAKELGVANILEGSVRLDENTVRINVQLIRARTEEDLWSEKYDRHFSDIFSIQSEVAQEVAKALKAKISPEVKRIIDLKLTSNPEAYKLYLQAMAESPYNNFDKSKAILFLKKAIELDPDFSMAYARLGNWLSQGGVFLSTSDVLNNREVWNVAKPYFIKALELNPDNGEAHNLFAWSLLWYEWNFKAAGKEYQETQRIFPNYSWTDYLLALGQFKEAYDGAIDNINFDSKNWEAWAGIITSSYFANREPGSEIRKALNNPSVRNDVNVRSESARIYMYMKEYDKAISIAKQLFKELPNVESPRLEAIQAISYYKTRRLDESNIIITKLKQRSEVNVGGSPSFYLAMIYTEMGDINSAFEWLEKSYHDHEVEMYWLKVEPPFEPLRRDPRFNELLDKVGFSSSPE